MDDTFLFVKLVSLCLQSCTQSFTMF